MSSTFLRSIPLHLSRFGALPMAVWTSQPNRVRFGIWVPKLGARSSLLMLRGQYCAVCAGWLARYHHQVGHQVMKWVVEGRRWKMSTANCVRSFTFTFAFESNWCGRATILPASEEKTQKLEEISFGWPVEFTLP